MIKVILVDAANTIIHKPVLWEKIEMVFRKHSLTIDTKIVREKHKIISELINFPDRTNEEFYRHFNSELLMALGLLPDENLLDDLFSSCTYLPWQAFEDTKALNSINLKKAVLSNFNSGLQKLLADTVSVNFDEIIVSEIEKVRKPQVEFYMQAIQKLNVEPDEILYIGDSIKLDIVPAQQVGMQTFLIDRENFYPYHKNRISSFFELEEKINHKS